MRKVVVAGFMVILLLPVWFMAIGSLQDIHGVFIMPPRWLPMQPTLDNWRWLFSRAPMVKWAINSVVVASVVVVVSVFASVTAGYAFAFYKWRGKRVTWLLLMAGIMVPRISLLIPLFVVVRKLGISGTLLAASIPVAFSPVGLYLARAYFETVPKSLLESARMDGANELQILGRVVVPLAQPIVTALALFSGIAGLQDFLWQMLQLQRKGVQTLVVGVTREVMLRGDDVMAVNPMGQAMASGMLLLIPVLIIFLIANRYFVSALAGAVKE